MVFNLSNSDHPQIWKHWGLLRLLNRAFTV